MASTSKTSGTPRWRGSFLRMVLESAAMLAISVSLFRAFSAQGFMIETGSMAPGLWGYHRRAECPSCHTLFSVGESRAAGMVACPNCGQRGIETDSLVRNDGDQLLVYRLAFDFQQPHRWGVIVFRNPANPQQAYVKRVVGLPAESLEIRRGDVYVNDQLQTKPLAIQRSLRIPVYNHNFLPEDQDPNWRSRWTLDPRVSGWEVHGTQFGFDGLTTPAPAQAGRKPETVELASHTQATRTEPLKVAAATGAAAKPAGRPEFAYVHYRHWIRSGGRHKTSVRISKWPENVPLPDGGDILEYNPTKKLLVCRGALPAERRDALKTATPPEFAKAIDELFEGSHVSPILDVYGYNGADVESGRRECRDLSLTLRLTVDDPGTAGEFAIGLTDGKRSYECRFEFARGEIHIVDKESGQTVRSLPIAGQWPGTSEIELSLMDQQLGLAVNQRDVFTWSYPDVEGPGQTPWQPAWFGGRGFRGRVGDVRLDRDVYYTSSEPGRAVGQPVQLGPREFFVLGDNSPISRDSRSWQKGEVLTPELLMGKPFLVHLPSTRRRIQVGSWHTEIRVPDVSRMRYIR